MSRTRHLWIVMSHDGRALCDRPDSPAVFFTRSAAKAWAYNNCSTPPRIVKVLIGGRA